MPEKNHQPRNHAKKNWTTPKLMVHGSVEQLTRQIKNKTFGGGDDVLVDSLAILSNAS